VKPVKHSVAVVVRGADGAFLVVKRPDDPDDLLAGVWGLPAVTRQDGEDEPSAAARVGREKLGVELVVGRKIGERTTDRNAYTLTLSDYEATVVSGTVAVPQQDASMTQYAEARFVSDPAVLAEAAAKGSVCAQILLESAGRPEETARESRPEAARVAAFRERLGLTSLIDTHTHFMPERLLAAVWKYFDEQGPLVGRPWPIRYRMAERARVETLRSFGVRAFTSMLYPHKPGMARSLNDWAADFAARTPGCLHTATFFAEPAAAGDIRHALDQGARVFKCHLQVGQFDPNDPVLDDAWGVLADAGVPVVTHCGSGPVPGKYTGPEPIAALLARQPRLRLVVAHLGMPEYREFLDLAERYDRVMLDTTMAFTDFAEEDAPFPRADLPRLEALGDRVLLGTDFPNIPYSYADALEAPERAGLGRDWLRAVCHDNAAALFGL
jgi:predicted TIM-barrel fold metal-dependent hydrolase/ADP-ribose pyrophosphatase YjhB (NUDIX family)